MNLRYEMEHAEKRPVEQELDIFFLSLSWMLAYG